MSKLLVVYGATGRQGSSVIRSVLADEQLRAEYTIRGTTRDPGSAKAQELAKSGVEVVAAEIDNQDSIRKAFEGAHTVFASTVTSYDGHTHENEVAHGRALADAAVAASVGFFIWSTLPHAGKISGGRLKHMGHFDGKEEAEQYIRGLPLRSAFFSPGCFMDNFHSSLAPRPKGDGTYALFSFIRPDTLLPLIDTANDTGKWVAGILADFPRHEGKVLSCATELRSLEDAVAAMASASGKQITYQQVPEETWRGFLPAPMVDYIADMLLYFQDYGYFGPGTAEKVQESAKAAKGTLTTFEQYLQANPLKLD